MMWKLLAILEERKIPFCFQCQGKNNYYNLSVEDPQGKSRSLGSKYFKDIEEGLHIMWGHLLAPQPMSSLPRPSGMPRPS